MEKEVLVYVDLQGAVHLAGRLWARMRKNRETATFEYDKSWLADTDRFFTRARAETRTGPISQPLRQTSVRSHRRLRFGPLWRVLMRRAERRRAEAQQE